MSYAFKDATEEDLIKLIEWIDKHSLSDHNATDLRQWILGGERQDNLASVSFADFNAMLRHLELMKDNNDHLDTYLIIGNQVTRVE